MFDWVLNTPLMWLMSLMKTLGLNAEYIQTNSKETRKMSFYAIFVA